MLKRATLLVLAAAAACGGGDGTSAADEPQGGITHVRIEGQLDVGTLGLLKRAIDHARSSRHDRLVVEIDTPGGEVDLMWKIARLLEEPDADDLVTVAWVHTHALSAGVMVALACDRIYMAPGAAIGAALPVAPVPGGIAELPEEGGVRAKMVSALSSEFRAMAEKSGRPGALAAAMVDPDLELREVEVGGARRIVTGPEYDDLRERGEPVALLRTIDAKGELLSLSAVQAVELGFADGIAESLDDLRSKIGGHGADLVTLVRSRSEDVLAFLDRIAPLLLVLGFVLGYLELKTPGFGLPGILSIACFAILLAGRYLAGLADVPHLVMVAAGVALVAVEIFLVPGTLWAGIAGGVLVIGGLLLAGLGPGFGLGSALDRALLVDAAFNLLLSALAALLGALLLSRFLPKTPVLRRMVLDPDRDRGTSAMAAEPVYARAPDARLARVGLEGVVRTDLRPVGKVALDQEPALECEALADGGAIERGARVRVVELREGRLVVARVP